MNILAVIYYILAAGSIVVFLGGITVLFGDVPLNQRVAAAAACMLPFAFLIAAMYIPSHSAWALLPLVPVGAYALT